MGILNRWRQIGRRYFWPHLLLGMFAASFGVPVLPGVGQAMLHKADSCPSLSRQSAFQAGFSQLARLKDVPRRPTYAVDYWHQHAIRTVIRHLSIAWAPAPLRVQHQVLLTTLGLLLNRK
ncbi:secA regulator SecM, partial [Sodalis-like symbiont of Bactericera trigonica]